VRPTAGQSGAPLATHELQGAVVASLLRPYPDNGSTGLPDVAGGDWQPARLSGPSSEHAPLIHPLAKSSRAFRGSEAPRDSRCAREDALLYVYPTRAPSRPPEGAGATPCQDVRCHQLRSEPPSYPSRTLSTWRGFFLATTTQGSLTSHAYAGAARCILPLPSPSPSGGIGCIAGLPHAAGTLVRV
jgi:hypothetical protein